MRNYVWIQCLILLTALGSTSPIQAADAPPESTALGAFALPDSSGTRVIALSPVSDLSKIRHLITRDGRLLEAHYVRTQPYSTKGTGRDATRNFRYLQGAVFAIRGGTVSADETCFLAADSLLRNQTLVRLKREIRPVEREHDAIRMVERVKARPVTHAWQLASAGKDTCALLLEFEPRGTNRLISLALWQHGAMATLDESAEVSDGDPTSVWRVGDEGRVEPGAFDVEFILRGGGASYVATEWSGEEGLSLELLRVGPDGQLEEVYSSYRYLSP